MSQVNLVPTLNKSIKRALRIGDIEIGLIQEWRITASRWREKRSEEIVFTSTGKSSLSISTTANLPKTQFSSFFYYLLTLHDDGSGSSKERGFDPLRDGWQWKKSEGFQSTISQKSCQKHSSQKISSEDFHALINRMIHLKSIVGLYKDRSASLRSDTSYIMLFWGTSPSVYDPCECVSRAWFWQGSSMLCVYNDRSRIVNNKRVTDQTNMFLPSLEIEHLPPSSQALAGSIRFLYLSNLHENKT